VAALVGALSASLAAMVGNFTKGRPKYAAVEVEVSQRLDSLGNLRQHLVDLVQRDMDAYEEVAAAFRLPKDTEEQKRARNARIQSASAQATEVLFSIADACLSVMEHGLWLAGRCRNGRAAGRSSRAGRSCYYLEQPAECERPPTAGGLPAAPGPLPLGCCLAC